MAAKKGFLDLPLKVRNHIYSQVSYDIVINDPSHAAITKRPGALLDIWRGSRNTAFYNNEIFQSQSAIIAANRQIHAEFYPILKGFIDEAPVVTFHILDFNFLPLMEWIATSSPQENARFRIGGERTLRVFFDFEQFKPMNETFLQEWLVISTSAHLDISYAVVMQYPQHPSWLGHGFQYPPWVKKYYEYIKSSEQIITSYLSDELMVSELQEHIEFQGKGKVREWYRRYWDKVYDALREPVMTYEQFDNGMVSIFSEEYYNVVENHIEPARTASEDIESDGEELLGQA